MATSADAASERLDARSIPFASHRTTVPAGLLHYSTMVSDRHSCSGHGTPSWSFEWRALMHRLSQTTAAWRQARASDGASDGPFMLRVGLNPYGLAYSIGLQGRGTARANRAPMAMEAFIALARRLGAACVELDGRWLANRSEKELAAIGDEMTAGGMTPLCSDWLLHQPGETLDHAIRYSAALGAPLLRLHLTPVLEGARARQGTRWPMLLEHAREVLKDAARKAAVHGLALAIENHQDLTSEELLALAAEAGDNVGVVMDTGNAFAVGEDPVAFACRAAARVRHLHLKDYRAQFTPEGYRLVRCTIGEGCVPFTEIAAVLPEGLTASIEPGALEARHIRLFDPSWWDGYPRREASELATALGRLQHRRLPDDEDARTPWETGADPVRLARYELDQIERSLRNIRAMGLAAPSIAS